MILRLLIMLCVLAVAAFAQKNPVATPGSDMPPIEPGVSQELARWRAANYSDVRYKLNLTLEKMSPVLKGTMEIRLRVSSPHVSKGSSPASTAADIPIILDWRKIRGHEDKSTISNVTINGTPVQSASLSSYDVRDKSRTLNVYEHNEHLVFRDGVVAGENVIKLDFTSPILTSGSAITRYVDKEDGSEYIYSLFVPSDASTAFPVFDQPDLKARFTLSTHVPNGWTVINNGPGVSATDGRTLDTNFYETKPISTYVFAFTAGPWQPVPRRDGMGGFAAGRLPEPDITFYVRASQSKKFEPHFNEVARLNREAVKYFEQYFDYKFPFPKYDLVLIPEFPFGGMEHAGATFLRESSIIFPQEPTKNDLVSRATLIFHEAAHQWFGDTVTMRWFDDLWLKEGFATFMGYKAMEKIMPEMNAWKVFYERIKQGAYQTDSTKGTTPIYQEIKNLSAAKSAYGNIVYNKAPAFLRQAEFYLGEDKFQTAVRAFLKKHEFGNAGWEDLVKEFEAASRQDLKEWANVWVKRPGLPLIMSVRLGPTQDETLTVASISRIDQTTIWKQKIRMNLEDVGGMTGSVWEGQLNGGQTIKLGSGTAFIFPNYGDYGYGIFLLDEKSRDYVLKNIQNETDPFLRSMMWGALWDSIREGELDPREYVELVVKVLSPGFSRRPPEGGTPNDDESTVALLLNRAGTAMNYYLSVPPAVAGGLSQKSGGKPAFQTATDELGARVERMLIERMQNAPTLGQRITFYRAFLNIAASENARSVLKEMLWNADTPAGIERDSAKKEAGKGAGVPLKPKDKFDIVTRLLILNDPDAPKLLADLEKTETSDDAKRWAYAAKAGIPTPENKAKYWNDFVNNKEISESWIEAAHPTWNSIRHSDLTLPYLQKALQELPNHKRNRKIFFVNGWLGAFIGGQRSEEALAIVNKFLADNPNLDKDLRLKILENVDIIERAVNIRSKYRGN